MNNSFHIHLYNIHLLSKKSLEEKTILNKILYSKNNKFYYKQDNRYYSKVENNSTYYTESDNIILYNYFNSLEFIKINDFHSIIKKDIHYNDIPYRIKRLLFSQEQLNYINNMLSIEGSTIKFELNIVFLILESEEVTIEYNNSNNNNNNSNKINTLLETISFYYDIVIKEYSNLYTSYIIKGNLDDCIQTMINYSKSPLLCNVI